MFMPFFIGLIKLPIGGHRYWGHPIEYQSLGNSLLFFD